jgi:hypothetical protein
MIIVEMKKHFELRAIEWWSAGLMFSWGFFVLLFPTTFQVNPACHALLEFAPQHIWGLAALMAGGLRLVALFVNGMWYRTPAVRWLTTMMSIFIWFCITAAFASSPIINMGVVLYGWLMAADLYSAYRSANDFIEAEAQRQLKKMPPAPSDVYEGTEGNVRRIGAR